MEIAASMPSPQFLLGCLLALLLWALLMVLLERHLWAPLRIHKALRAQGIGCLPFRPIVGNFSEVMAVSASAHSLTLPLNKHHITPKVLPFYEAWSAQYGKNFLFWLGSKPVMVLSDPELCKDILYGKNGNYPKGKAFRPDVINFLENGLPMLDGERWSYHRRLLNPVFYMEKLKGLAPTFINLAANMLDRWQLKLQLAKDRTAEIDVNEEFMVLTGEVIAHTAFGSSYKEGKQVFHLQRELQQDVLLKLFGSLYIPGSRFLPTALNRLHWRLAKQIERIVAAIIHKRLDSPELNKSGNFGDDLLGVMLSAFKSDTAKESAQAGSPHPNPKLTLCDIIDECKTFFFAGNETTAMLLTWATMLLSINPEWQERAREEVINLFGLSHPDADALSQMKVVGMILNEALRLYPPFILLLRDAPMNMKLGELIIPAGTSFMIPILPLHVDPELWGPDAHEFNPQRFANGVVNACKHPTAFLPFSQGPRNCVGQNFAIIEAKIVLCMILQRFRMRLSPGYKHSPSCIISMQAKHGMPIIMEAI